MAVSKRYSQRTAQTLATVARIAYYKQTPGRVGSRLSELGLELAAFVDDEETDAHGLIAYDDQRVVIAFRGSESVKEFLTDIDSPPKRVSLCGHRCRLASDVYRAYKSVVRDVLAQVRPLLDELPRDIFLTGHGPGGAVAVLCAFALYHQAEHDGISVYTFGSSKVGDERFAEAYDEAVPCTYRIRYRRDIVTTMPAHGYQHVGREKVYAADGTRLRRAPHGVSLADHRLANYVRTLSA